MNLFNQNYLAPIYFDTAEPACVRYALQDLSTDFEKVCGRRASISDTLTAENERGIIVGTLDNARFCSCLAENGINADDLIGKWEAYRILTKNDCLFVIGSNPRGTMWGIYECAKTFLGIDPLYLWTDLAPKTLDSLEIGAIDLTDAPKTYRFRGWFINDEDLLEGFSKQSKPERGYRFHGDYMPVLKMIVETALRLKQNLLIPCSHLDITRPEEEAIVRYITERGIFFSMHHQEPVGVHQFTIDRVYKEKGIENINFIDHTELYREIWTDYISRFAKYDNIIWQLGLRGRGDRPVWYNNPRAPETTEERGKLIGDAMQMQLDIIKEYSKDKEILATSTLWMEGMPLYKEKALKFPENTIIVMSDFGPNQMWGEGFYTAPRFDEYDYGVYYHLAFWGCGPHIVQGNPLEKIAFNYRAAVEKGDSEYSVLNVSNFREHLMGVAYTAQVTWDIENADIDTFRRDWCRREFATEQTAAIEEVYRDYFDCFYRMDSELIDSHMLLMDGMCKRVAWKLMGIIKGEGFRKDDIQNKKLYDFDSANDFVYYYMHATAEGLLRFEKLQDKAEAALETVDPSRRDFYRSNLLVHLAIITGLYRWVYHLTKAAASTLGEGDCAVFAYEVKAAASALRAASDSRSAAIYGKWTHWYDGDRLMNLAGDAQATEDLLG